MSREPGQQPKTVRLSAAALGLLGVAGLFVAGLTALRGADESEAALSAPSPSPFRAVVHVPGISTDGTPDPTWTPTPVPTATPTPKRPASPQGLRVYSNGDSTSYFMTVALYSLMQNLGSVPVAEAEYKISSGLVRTDFFDWYAYLATQMAAYQPDVVVFMVGANDALQTGGLDAYRQRVAAMMDQLRAPARLVVWVGQPIMDSARSASLAAAIPGLNQVFREEAAARPWVLYVDAYALTADANGNYADYLPDETGTLRLMRAGDGIHFTPEGGRRLALGVIAALFPPN